MVYIVTRFPCTDLDTLQIKRHGNSIHQNLGIEQDIISGSIELYLAIDWTLLYMAPFPRKAKRMLRRRAIFFPPPAIVVGIVSSSFSMAFLAPLSSIVAVITQIFSDD